LSEEHEGAEDLPEEVDQRLAELEQAIAEYDERPAIYDPADIARAGIFVSIDHACGLKVERGFVRVEDEAPAAAEGGGVGADTANGQPMAQDVAGNGAAQAQTGASLSSTQSANDEDETETSPKLSDRLMSELTAHRTLALREALANDPDAAFFAATHALTLDAFYGGGGFETCIEIDAKSVLLGSHAPGLGDTPAARAIDETHGQWQLRLPEKAQDLWAWLVNLDRDARASLFAHCVGLSVNALHLAHDRRPRALAHADLLAEHLALEMTAYWNPTAESYFGKVTKSQILAAVREAKGEATAQMIGHLKKLDMAAEAERLLDGAGWLPEILRTKNLDAPAPAHDGESASEDRSAADDADLPAFLAEDGGADDSKGSEFEPRHSVVAAE
jgi:ParB family chromosome partitioning protein